MFKFYTSKANAQRRKPLRVKKLLNDTNAKEESKTQAVLDEASICIDESLQSWLDCFINNHILLI